MREIVSLDFITACSDYFSLQEKEYPQRLVFKIICDRYKLNTIQRVILYRGIFPAREVEKRKLKCLTNLPAVNLSVDVSNVIFRLSNYLCGRPVFLCNDSLLRDAGDAFDKEYSNEIMNRSVEMMIGFLSSQSLISLNFVVDTPVDNAQLIISALKKTVLHFKFPVAINEVYPADRFLEGPNPHVIATADSKVIDRLPYPVFDIPRAILDKHFHPEYLNLTEILKMNINP